MSPRSVLIAALLAISCSVHAATPQEEANKRTVVAFYEAALFRYDSATALQYVGERYVQHNPLVPDGIAAFKGFIDSLKATRKGSFSSIKRALADGDLVALHVHMKQSEDDPGRAIVDIFRLENGKIVEHWDVIQPVPDKAANPNTMF